MSKTPPHYDERVVFGPFHRKDAPQLDKHRFATAVLTSGELRGDVPSWGGDEAVQARQGPVPDGYTGFTFWTPIAPIGNWGPPVWPITLPGIGVSAAGLASIPILIESTNYDLS